MASFDGTNKGSGISVTNVDYAAENKKVASRQDLRDNIIMIANPESVKALDINNYKIGVEGDAADMTKEQWHNRRYGNRALKRLGTIGASASSHVMGCCPYNSSCTNFDLYHEVLGDTPAVPDEEDSKRQHIFDVGHGAEEWLQKKMQEMYPYSKVIVDTRIYNDPKRPWMTANLDFMMQLSDGGWIHGEFKTTNVFANPREAYGPDNAPRIPPQYQTQLIQCQHLLNVDESRLVCAVMKPSIEKVPSEVLLNPSAYPKFNFEDFVVDVIVRPYFRDLDIEKKQMDAMDDFWYGHVLPEIEPTIVGNSAQVNAAIRRWKGYAKQKTPIMLPTELASQCAAVCLAQNEVIKLNKKLKMAQKAEDAATALLKQVLGTVQIAECHDAANAYRVEFEPTKGRVSFKGDKLKYENPNLYDELVDKGYVIPAKKEAGRTFSVSLLG